jgi:site-specific DNA-methyltransferase (adenine-specific)
VGERRRRPTATSAFGVSKREGHDSSGFYARFAPPELSDDAVVNEPKVLDELLVGDSRHMSDVADASVALVVTSPPYFAGKAYEEALGEDGIPGSYLEYLQLLEEVFAECVRTLEPGGRIAVNVANLGRKPYRSLAGDVTTILQDRLRLLLRGEIVWRKAKGAAGSCAWGSYRSPANPTLRDLTERVVIASKGRFDRARRGEATIGADEFMEATLDVWELPAESATRVGHPAPFPVELPQRLIELYTWRDDLVLDPFMGVGTTAVAAQRAARHYVGYDTDEGYVAAARARLAGDAEARPKRPARPTDQASKVAADLLTEAGFRDLVVDRKPTRGAPLTVDIQALDRDGSPWWFLVAGSFATGAGGLRRTDVLWRTLARASTLAQAGPAVPIVVLATAVPAPKTANDQAIRPLIGPVLHAVVELVDPGALDQLRSFAAGVGPAQRAR